MAKKTLTAKQLLESIDKGEDDSASDSDDSVELRYETEDEEAREVENEEENIFASPTFNLKTNTATPAFSLIRSETVEMIDQIDSLIEIIPGELAFNFLSTFKLIIDVTLRKRSTNKSRYQSSIFMVY